MREVKTVSMICVKDDYGFEYHISKIEYIEREDESYTYLFTPNYSVIDLLPSSIFQGIPGLNLDPLKADEVFTAFQAGKISEAEAVAELGISRSTFYRRLKLM